MERTQLKRERKLVLEQARRQAHGPKPVLDLKKEPLRGRVWIGRNGPLGKGVETPTASMHRQALSILKQLGSNTR